MSIYRMVSALAAIETDPDVYGVNVSGGKWRVQVASDVFIEQFPQHKIERHSAFHDELYFDLENVTVFALRQKSEVAA